MTSIVKRKLEKIHKNTVKITFDGVFSIYSCLFGRFQELTIGKKSRGTNAWFSTHLGKAISSAALNKSQSAHEYRQHFAQDQAPTTKIGRSQGSQTANDTCASIPSKENPAYIQLLYPENSKFYYAQKDGSAL